MRVVQNPTNTEYLCAMIAKHFRNLNINFVVGPTTAGIVLAYEVAKKLGTPCLFAEKVGEERFFKRGLQPKKGDRVLVVDDILTTGKSINEVIRALEQHQAEVAAIAVLVDRSEEGLRFAQIPFFACLTSPAKAFAPGNCPLCQQRLPLTIPGGAKAPQG